MSISYSRSVTINKITEAMEALNILYQQPCINWTGKSIDAGLLYRDYCRKIDSM